MNDSLDRVRVATSPFDWVAKNRAAKSTEEVESSVCEPLEDVDAPVLIATPETFMPRLDDVDAMLWSAEIFDKLDLTHSMTYQTWSSSCPC